MMCKPDLPLPVLLSSQRIESLGSQTKSPGPALVLCCCIAQLKDPVPSCRTLCGHHACVHGGVHVHVHVEGGCTVLCNHVAPTMGNHSSLTTSTPRQPPTAHSEILRTGLIND